ncbi:hypothetical protein BDR04DRAFT_1118418 [Suillus decipiens]|nr:hypothetical protein BDR04DRAFT_1118418 [Suillus decipiens]
MSMNFLVHTQTVLVLSCPVRNQVPIQNQKIMESLTNQNHAKKAKKTKDRVLRQEVAASRKTVASTGTLARKCKSENVNSDIDSNEQIQQLKHAKGNQSASNLNPDWRKMRWGDLGHLPKPQAVAVAIQFQKVAVTWWLESLTLMSLRRRLPLHKSTRAMGLKINKKGADNAVKEEVKVVKMLKLQKPLWKLKLEDLPLQDKMIDWAGTTTDPFGTNEHSELSLKLQEL